MLMLIEQNKIDNYIQLKKSIVSAAKSYVSDYRYEISVDGTNVISINGTTIENNEIKVRYLVDEGKLTLDKNGYIKDPRNKDLCLDFDKSYVVVNFDTTKKDYVFKDIDDLDTSTGYLDFTEKCE